MKTNQLIVLEGGDGAGKGTQTELLISSLQKHGHKVEKRDFPRYQESLFGQVCGRALKGEFGDFKALSPYLASMPYALDRVSAKTSLLKDLEKGIVISNRYTPSSVAYQAAKLSGEAQQDFIKFMEESEYGELGLPKPNLVIYLYVPVEIAHELVAKKEARDYMGGQAGTRDQHEQDVAYQRAVVETYLLLAKTRPEWKIIDCVKNGTLLSKEDIHDLVVKEVNGLLG